MINLTLIIFYGNEFYLLCILHHEKGLVSNLNLFVFYPLHLSGKLLFPNLGSSPLSEDKNITFNNYRILFKTKWMLPVKNWKASIVSSSL